MPRTIITAGSAYTDIDVLACGSALARLLQLQGLDAIAVLAAPFNATVPSSVRLWDLSYKTKVPMLQADDSFIIVDVSNPAFFETFVDPERIVAVYDHHFGFEEYWEQKIGSHAHVEHVGSCATIIWEQYTESGFDYDIGTAHANILYIAILANTLNMQASVTHMRDIEALESLEQYIDLPDDYIAEYYSEIEESVLQRPIATMQADTKRLKIGTTSYCIAQLELWNAQGFLQDEDIVALAKKALNPKEGERWLLSIVSISEGKNYLVTMDKDMQVDLNAFLDASFKDGIAGTTKLWMRKELLRELEA